MNNHHRNMIEDLLELVRESMWHTYYNMGSYGQQCAFCKARINQFDEHRGHLEDEPHLPSCHGVLTIDAAQHMIDMRPIKQVKEGPRRLEL